MAQPPAVVARTFKPVGQLQLHRLGGRADFHCVRCRKDKTATLVATMGGDWTQTVCNGCYSLLVNAQREEATKAAKAKRHRVPAKQQPSGKVRPKNTEGSPPRLIGKKEQQLQHRLPGVDRLLVFSAPLVSPSESDAADPW